MDFTFRRIYQTRRTRTIWSWRVLRAPRATHTELFHRDANDRSMILDQTEPATCSFGSSLYKGGAGGTRGDLHRLVGAELTIIDGWVFALPKSSRVRSSTCQAVRQLMRIILRAGADRARLASWLRRLQCFAQTTDLVLRRARTLNDVTERRLRLVALTLVPRCPAVDPLVCLPLNRTAALPRADLLDTRVGCRGLLGTDGAHCLA